MVKKLVKGVSSVSKKVSVITKEERTWEELKAIERRRREILKRQGRFSFFRIVFFWDGTLLKLLSTDRLMWLTIGIYAVIRIGAHLNALPEVLNDIAGADIAAVGVFLSFFLVLFVNDANTSLDTLYGLSMKCKGRILDCASLARTTLPRVRGLRLVRYLNAAHIAGYVGLSQTYTFRNFFTEINQINQFLTPQEVKRMEEIDMNAGGSAYRELIEWCLMEVASAENDGLIDHFLATQYRDQILQLRASFGALYNDDDQPITFAYYHFICFLSAVYVPLFAMSAALDAGIGDAAYWLTDIVTGLIVMLQAIFVVGLRVLAEVMSDPYGDDVCNLSLMHYINFTWVMSNRIMLATNPGPLDPNTEEKMCQDKAPIGAPWDDDEKLSKGGVFHWSDCGVSDRLVGNEEIETSTRLARSTEGSVRVSVDGEIYQSLR